MAAVLSAAYPLKAPQLFAYMRTIVRASRNFEGTVWVLYDMSYRRAAANKGSLDWGLPDPGRFNDAFVGRAKVVPRCSFCLSDTHVADSCPDAPAQNRPAAANKGSLDWGLPDPGRFNDAFVGRAKVVPRSSFCLSDTYVADTCPDAPAQNRPAAAGLADTKAVTAPLRPPQQGGRAANTVEICRSYNSPAGSRSRFQSCRFAHLCCKCHHPHPASECRERAQGQQRARSPLGPGRWEQKQPR